MNFIKANSNDEITLDDATFRKVENNLIFVFFAEEPNQIAVLDSDFNYLGYYEYPMELVDYDSYVDFKDAVDYYFVYLVGN